MEKSKVAYLSIGEFGKKKGVRLINVLPPEFFEEESIPDSINVCIYEVVFMDKIKEIIPNKNEEIVVYGDSGESEEATYAAEALISEGYKKVFVFKGGMKEWKKSGSDICCGEKVSHGLKDGSYDLDLSDSRLDWVGRKIGNKHNGSFGLKSGKISIKNGEIKGKLVVDMDKILNLDLVDKEYNSMLIRHLKSRDFFESEKYPEAVIEISSSKVLDSKLLGDSNYKLTGNLTIKGICKEIKFLASIHESEGKIIFNSHFDIDRSDWNIKYGSEKFFAKLGMHLVSDLVSIDVVLKGKLNEKEAKDGMRKT